MHREMQTYHYILWSLTNCWK